MSFAEAARDDPAFASELPRFLAAVWRTFNEYEIAGYVASRKPMARNRLRQLLTYANSRAIPETRKRYNAGRLRSSVWRRSGSQKRRTDPPTS